MSPGATSFCSTWRWLNCGLLRPRESERELGALRFYWRPVQLVTGDVEPPPGHQFMLITTLPAAGDLGFLRELAAGALDVLHVFAPRLEPRDLAQVAGLEGLSVLVVSAGEPHPRALEIELPRSLRVLATGAATPAVGSLPTAIPASDPRLRNLMPRDRAALAGVRNLSVTADAAPEAYGREIGALRRLSLNVPALDFGGIDWSSLDDLTDVSVTGSELAFGTLGALATARRLTQLTLTFCDVEYGALSRLRRLALPDGAVPGDWVTGLSELESLSLGTGLDDPTWTRLASGWLRALRIPGGAVALRRDGRVPAQLERFAPIEAELRNPGETLGRLLGASSLEQLNLSFSRAAREALDGLPPMPRPRPLELYGVDEDDPVRVAERLARIAGTGHRFRLAVADRAPARTTAVGTAALALFRVSR